MTTNRPTLFALALVAALGPFAAASCARGGGAGAGGESSTTGAGGDVGTDAGANGGSDGGGEFFDQNNCTNGQACDGGVCVGSTCCPEALACADACCSAGEVCSFQKCVTPGAPCHESSDCSASEFCEYSLGDDVDAGAPDGSCMGGAAQQSGKCLPRPPICAADGGTPDGGAPACLEPCEHHPTGAFSPVLEVAWGGQITPPYATDVMMTPIVIELDDDDCDGKVTEKDIPEIVFTSFAGGAYTSNGTLHAISYVGGALVDKWSQPGINPAFQIAGGNIDGVPGNEIVACGDQQPSVKVFKGDGTPLWTANVQCYMPQIADLDGDGHPEIVVDGGILDGATGVVKVPFSPVINNVVLSDLDGDGKLDIVTSTAAYHADGSKFVDTGLLGNWNWPAIADFDLDGKPEVVDIDNTAHTLAVWRYDANQPNKLTIVRSAIDINAPFGANNCPAATWGAQHGGGPPTVADFNGDGTPDVGLAGGVGYVVFNGKKLVNTAVTGPSTVLWSAKTQDCSSASTGSSVFDFDGDGKAEVVYSDERYLRIYDGTNGNVLFQTCNTTGTLLEYPVIADVDSDGHADIVVVSNAFWSGDSSYQCNDGAHLAQAGVRVFGDANSTWVRTRRVWNEHTYHVTNVNEDGTIPAMELPNWTQPGLNDFRQNKQPGSEFSAPDAVVSVSSLCPGPSALVATVRNIGQAALPAGALVGFYEGPPPSGTKLGQAVTGRILYPAESDAVTLVLAAPDPALVSGAQPVYAVVDDGMPSHPGWHECRTDNNTSAAVSAKCETPK
jgi:hypothetical protein